MPKTPFDVAVPPLMLAPMTTYSSHPNGVVSPDELTYIEARARAGFDWIATAACCVHPSGWAFDGQWQAWDAPHQASIKAMADVIRKAGSKSILQIHHGGRQCPSRLCGEPVSASAVRPLRPNAETPRALTLFEIEAIIESYIQAAKMARDAGYDGVEIHGANTYLIQQFVSPHSNRRTDIYGRDRCLFAERIARGIVQAVGSDIVVGYRFSPEEAEFPGIRMEHTFELLDRLIPLGLDYLSVSLRRYDMSSLHGTDATPITQRIARHLASRVPLVTVGQVFQWSDVEAALALGAQSVAVGKAAILNPEWPSMARSGSPMRRAFPKVGAAKDLVLPAGLERKILSVPGWFPMED